MFGLINAAAYWAFLTLGIVMMSVILVGMTIVYPIPSLVGWGLAYVLMVRPLLRWSRRHRSAIRGFMLLMKDLRRQG